MNILSPVVSPPLPSSSGSIKSKALNLEAQALQWISRWSASLGPLGAGFFAWALSTFVASPAFFGWSWESIAVRSRAADYLRLCVNPLDRNLVEPIMAYRLTLPIISWLLHLPPIAALALPYVAHIGFLALSFLALRRRAQPAVALLTTLVLALSFALFWSNWRPGYTDTVTHLLAAGLLLLPGPSWVLVGTFFGLLNDERMVFALPFVLCWHFPPTLSTAWVRTSASWLTAALGGILAYGLVRHGLTVGWIGRGIASVQVYHEINVHVGAFRPHLGSWWVWALNVFLAFRWGWFLVVAYLFSLWKSPDDRLLAAAFGTALLAGVLASAVVADVARSVGFMAPAWALAAVGLQLRCPAGLPRWLLRTVGALLVTPVFFTFEHFHLQWFRPLPIVLFRCLAGANAPRLPFL